MGYRTTWLAAEGMALEELVLGLGWKLTGASSSTHDEPGMVAFRRGRWAVVVADGYSHWKDLSFTQARELSQLGQIIYFRQSDGDMVSEIVCLQQGEVTWHVKYADGETQTAGSPPKEAREIHQRLEAYARRSGSGPRNVAHLYELPAELGLAIVGFRHDDRVADDLFYALGSG